MRKVVLDQATLAMLRAQRERVEVCDESGQTVGYFNPPADRSRYSTVEVPITEAELRKIEENLTGRPLADILADLEKKA